MMRRLLTLGPDNEPLWVPLDVYPVGDPWHSVIVTDGVPPPGRARVCGERRPMMPLRHPLTQVANAALTIVISRKELGMQIVNPCARCVAGGADHGAGTHRNL